MADPGFLELELSVSIEPAIALLNSLNEMLKINSWAVVNVKGDKIQIVATTPDRAYVATHDTLLSFVFGHWNPPHGCAFHVELITWIQRLTYPILQQPFSLVYIFKPPGSPSLQFRFRNTQQEIDLGSFLFMQPIGGVYLNDFHSKVRVAIYTESFREAIQAYSSQFNSVLLDISSGTTIRWIAPSGAEMIHPAVMQYICSSITASDSQLLVKWTWPLYPVISSILNVYQEVEISVVTDWQGIYWHHFRFVTANHANSFCYLERRPRAN